MNNRFLILITCLLLPIFGFAAATESFITENRTGEEPDFEMSVRDPFQPPIYPTENETDFSLTGQNEQEQEIEYQVIALQYANAEQIAEQLQKNQPALLTKWGKIEHDPLTNSLILEDKFDAITRIKNWLKEVDTPQQQVQITAHIVTSSREALHELGIHWGVSADPQNQSVGLNRLNLHQPAGNQRHRLVLNTARIHANLLELELSALEQESQLEIIASPRLTASHQQPASIKQGSDIPYIVQDKDKTTVQFKEAVLGMEVTPHILRQGKIRLALKISQNAPGFPINQGGNENLAIDKQEIITQVTIRNGETLILGGIFQQKKTTSLQKVPYLSDLPLLGALFNQKGEQHSRRELVIFITPQLTDI
ncbi:secretin N-terminal domain-containing protein [Xenorhabdus anantnagensis]|uniref:Secretin N-terminal domain-containing protein n=1 Tax=Xenorhabdus anantnagensis TaxID=3025875 RepID=A0ABT5LYK9_9GAMM|nr:secretin N-terminal domain-containing protein [Xenorhabdus anantnagensis]MDC9598144.1 secretin N-terminal domain-containing protein [Xenorhabdus anantnagensis]